MASKLLKNSMIYALGDILPKALSFIVFPILTSHLSLSDYGIISYVNTFNLLLTIGGFLGINTYYLVHYYRVGSEENQQKLLGNLTIFILGINITITLLMFVLGYIYPTIFSNEIEFFPYIAMGIITNLFSLMTILPSALFRVQERPLPLTILNVMKGVVTMALTVILVVQFQYKATGVIFATMLVSIIFGLIFLRITIRNMIWNINWPQLKRSLKFSLPLLPGALASYLFTMSDRFFIERYLDLTQLGTYSTAATLALILNIVAYGAYKAFEPHFFQSYGKEGFTQSFIKIHNHFLLVILIMSMGLSMFAREFFQLFASASYQEVYYYVPLIEFGLVLAAMQMLYGTVITAQEKTKLNSLIAIVGGVASVSINMILIPHIGIIGSCIASATAFCLMLVISVYKSHLNINYTRPLLALLITTLTAYIGTYLLQPDNLWMGVVIKVIIILAVIIILTRVLGIKLPKKLLPLHR